MFLKNLPARPQQAGFARPGAGRNLGSTRLSQNERRVLTTSATVPRENSLYVEACHYVTDRRYEEAREVFEALLRRHPHMCNAWVTYAQVLLPGVLSLFLVYAEVLVWER